MEGAKTFFRHDIDGISSFDLFYNRLNEHRDKKQSTDWSYTTN